MLWLFKRLYRYHREKLGSKHMDTKIRDLLKTILADLIEADLYNLDGLSRELNVPREVLESLFVSENAEPSYSFAINLMHLHYEKFPSLYDFKSLDEKSEARTASTR